MQRILTTPRRLSPLCNGYKRQLIAALRNFTLNFLLFLSITVIDEVLGATIYGVI